MAYITTNKSIQPKAPTTIDSPSSTLLIPSWMSKKELDSILSERLGEIDSGKCIPSELLLKKYSEKRRYATSV